MIMSAVMSHPPILVIPGYDGSGPNHWQTLP
ncbi:MAG: alpha/beta hydrolase [Deltaproteobacteria bacterium]|nr:alpha/beta hydrolase [Deltaproteobacteria bacterium]